MLYARQTVSSPQQRLGHLRYLSGTFPLRGSIPTVRSNARHGSELKVSTTPHCLRAIPPCRNQDATLACLEMTLLVASSSKSTSTMLSIQTNGNVPRLFGFRCLCWTGYVSFDMLTKQHTHTRSLIVPLPTLLAQLLVQTRRREVRAGNISPVTGSATNLNQTSMFSVLSLHGSAS